MANSMSYQNGVDRLMPVKCFIKRTQMKQTVAVDHVSFLTMGLNEKFKFELHFSRKCERYLHLQNSPLYDAKVFWVIHRVFVC